MSGLSFHQVEPTLDALYALVEPIHTAMNARNAFFDMSGPNLKILDVVNKAIDALFHTRQARLDLLQHRHDEVGDFTHGRQHTCSCVVPQGA